MLVNVKLSLSIHVAKYWCSHSRVSSECFACVCMLTHAFDKSKNVSNFKKIPSNVYNAKTCTLTQRHGTRARTRTIYLSDGNIDDIDKQTKTYFDTTPPNTFIFFEDAAKVRMSSVNMFVKRFVSVPCFLFKIVFNKKSFNSTESTHTHQLTAPVWLSELRFFSAFSGFNFVPNRFWCGDFQ